MVSKRQLERLEKELKFIDQEKSSELQEVKKILEDKISKIAERSKIEQKKATDEEVNALAAAIREVYNEAAGSGKNAE